MPMFITNGKQVLKRDTGLWVHYADAIKPADADDIAAALNLIYDQENDESAPLVKFDDDDNVTHAIRQEMDEYACSCGMRWDRIEGPDHP